MALSAKAKGLLSDGHVLNRVFVTLGLPHTVGDPPVEQDEYRWSVDGHDVVLPDGRAFEGFDRIVAFSPARIENYRNLATLVLADQHGSWRDRFDAAGITGIPFVGETWLMMPGATPSAGFEMERLFRYAGQTIGMNYSAGPDGELLALNLGGPFAKIGSRQGAWTSEDSQNRLTAYLRERNPPVEDQCMKEVGKSRTFKWHRA